MNQFHIALLFFVILGCVIFKILRWLKVNEYRRSNVEASYYICSLILVALVGEGSIGFERPGYFEKAGYELKNQSGILYFPISEVEKSVTFDIQKIGLNSAGLVNVRDAKGNKVFSDYSCSKNSLGTIVFICNKILLTYPAYRDWSEDMLPFLVFGR